MTCIELHHGLLMLRLSSSTVDVYFMPILLSVEYRADSAVQ